jgi:hypothetical protein
MKAPTSSSHSRFGLNSDGSVGRGRLPSEVCVRRGSYSKELTYIPSSATLSEVAGLVLRGLRMVGLASPPVRRVERERTGRRPAISGLAGEGALVRRSRFVVVPRKAEGGVASAS